MHVITMPAETRKDTYPKYAPVTLVMLVPDDLLALLRSPR